MQVDSYKAIVEDIYLKPYGLRFNQVVARSPFGFTPINEFAKEQREDTLGNLIADSMSMR